NVRLLHLALEAFDLGLEDGGYFGWFEIHGDSLGRRNVVRSVANERVSVSLAGSSVVRCPEGQCQSGPKTLNTRS
ncbi:MAG: hypothetical protein ACI8UD_003484, partial [Planctomycetota bacterium]